jgi:hypothetical protein
LHSLSYGGSRLLGRRRWQDIGSRSRFSSLWLGKDLRRRLRLGRRGVWLDRWWHKGFLNRLCNRLCTSILRDELLVRGWRLLWWHLR